MSAMAEEEHMERCKICGRTLAYVVRVSVGQTWGLCHGLYFKQQIMHQARDSSSYGI